MKFSTLKDYSFNQALSSCRAAQSGLECGFVKVVDFKVPIGSLILDFNLDWDYLALLIGL